MTSKNTKQINPTELVCGHCQKPITRNQHYENYCSECKTAYCDEHFKWSEWHYVALVSETMIRFGTCVKGHEKQETDP